MWDWGQNQQISLEEKKRKDEALRRMAAIKNKKMRVSKLEPYQNNETQNNDHSYEQVELQYMSQDMESNIVNRASLFSKNSYNPMIQQ